MNNKKQIRIIIDTMAVVIALLAGIICGMLINGAKDEGENKGDKNSSAQQIAENEENTDESGKQETEEDKVYSEIVYEAEVDSVSDEQMSTVINIMRKRLDSLGYTAATVRKQRTKEIVVEIPEVSDPDEAVALLGQTAQIKFFDAQGNEVLNGTDIKKAVKQYDQLTEGSEAENYVELQLTDAGAQKMKKATKVAANAPEGENYIAIMLDDQVVSMPSVSSEYAKTGIDSDTVVISGGFDAKGAEELASIINAGQLPFSLKVVSESVVVE